MEGEIYPRVRCIDELIRNFGSNGVVCTYFLNVLLKNMDEDQICAFLNKLINAVQKNELYIKSFDFISDNKDGTISILLRQIDFSCMSGIEKLIKVILLKKNIKILFNKCTFGNNFVEYFINNNIDDNEIKFKENNSSLVFTEIELQNADLSNVGLKDFKKMIKNRLLLQNQKYTNCSFNDEVLFAKKSSKILFGGNKEELRIFEFISLNKDNCRIKKIIDDQIMLVSYIKENKLRINNRFVSMIMKEDIKSKDGKEILIKKGDLSGLNLSGLNLRGINLDNLVNIKDTILYKTKLNKNQIKKIIELDRKDLSCIDISSLTIQPRDGIDLSSCNLAGANLTNTKLEELNLKNTNFSSANMHKTSFISSDITEANFENAKITKVKFDCRQLNLIFNNRIKGIRKEDPNSLSMTHLKSADFKKINFDQVNVQNFIAGREFILAIVRGNIKGRQKGDLSNLDLHNMFLATYKKKDFINCVNFTNTNLKHVMFSDEIIELILTNGLSAIKKGDLSFLDLRYNNIENFDFTNANTSGVITSNKQVKLIIEGKIKGWDPNNFRNFSLAWTNLIGCDLSNVDLTGSNLYHAKFDEKAVQLIIDGKLKGRKKGDLSYLDFSLDFSAIKNNNDLSEVHFHDYIDLTEVSYDNMKVNCGFLKLMLEGKIKGIPVDKQIVLENQDLSNLGFPIDLITLITKYYIFFIRCKFNKKQLLSILKSNISVELYNKHFNGIDLTNINLNEIDFTSEDIRQDLKDIMFSKNVILTPEQTESISNPQIKELTFRHDGNSTTMDPINNNNRITSLKFDVSKIELTSIQLLNCYNNIFGKTFGKLDKISTGFSEKDIKPLNIQQFNNNPFRLNNTMMSNSITFNNTMQFNTPNNTLNNNTSLRRMSNSLNEMEMEIIKFKEKPSNIHQLNNNPFRQNNTMMSNSITFNNTMQFNTPNNTLNNNTNASLRQMSDSLNKMKMEFNESKEKPSNIHQLNSNPFQQNNTMMSDGITFNNTMRFNTLNSTPMGNNTVFNNVMRFNTPNNTLNNNTSLRQMSNSLNEMEMEFDESKEKSSDTLFNK